MSLISQLTGSWGEGRNEAATLEEISKECVVGSSLVPASLLSTCSGFSVNNSSSTSTLLMISSVCDYICLLFVCFNAQFSIYILRAGFNLC